MDCLGDTQDADYQISQSAQIDGGKVIAVVGTLSKATGNATYTSLSVNWFPELVGVANIDDTDLLGTAARFGTANSSLFYVYYVARDCTGLTPCREISKRLVPTGGTHQIHTAQLCQSGFETWAGSVQDSQPRRDRSRWTESADSVGRRFGLRTAIPL